MKSLIASWQMYKKTRTNTTYFKYVSLTTDKTLLANLSGLRPSSKDILFDKILPQLNRANHVKDDNLVERLTIELDFGNVTRQYKSKMLKELKDINLLTKVKGDTYVINVAYINPFNDSQTREFIKQMMLTDVR